MVHALFSVSFQTTPRAARPTTLSLTQEKSSFESRARNLGERPTSLVRARVCLSLEREREHEQRRKQFRGAETTLSQAWSGNCIRGPQCAFEMSMFMCPAVHKLTRN